MATIKKAINQIIPNFERPLTTVDVVIFAVIDDALCVLLVRRNSDANEPFPNHWALPGGFVNVALDSTLEACALRKLKEKTGVANAYLEQLASWGNKTRDPRGWSTTHAYFSLIASDAIDHIGVSAGLKTNATNAVDVAWVKILGDKIYESAKLPLAFDHKEIVAAAIERLRSKVEYTSLPAYLVAHEFTLSELQKAYEIVLGRKLEKSAFRTRVLATKLVVEVPRFREGANRPAQLYKLRSMANPVFFQRTFKPA